MTQAIKTIDLPLIMHFGSVNCYCRSGSGYILIDTGGANGRARLEQELTSAGCVPGMLKLIVLTHGDFDHAGNAAYLRTRFSTKIAMHNSDAGMIEHGNMFWNRKPPNTLFKSVASLLFPLAKADRMKPDLSLKDGDDLSGYGLEARVLHLPGHSRGSISILTAQGDLFCGDLLAEHR